MEKEQALGQLLPFWGQLTTAQQARLADGCVAETFEKGRLVGRTEAGCRGALCLQSGQLRVYIVSDEGREVTLYRLQAGEVCVLSASCLLDSIAFEVVIEAAAPTCALLIPSAVLHEVMGQNSAVELYLAKAANARFSAVMWTMQQILFLGADKRVARFLWEESARTGSPVLHCTHEEMARLIGTAREVVTRVLKYLAAEGVVTLGRGKTEIIDPQKLETLL